MADPPQYPQYPVYPYPPQHPYSAPYWRPPRRPGLTTAAVVLMWIQVGLGLLGGITTAYSLTAGRDVFAELVPGLADWVPLVLLLFSMQALLFAALRSLYAVRIIGRSASARRGALVVESAAIGVQVVWQAVLYGASMPYHLEQGTSFNFQFDCTGIVLSVLILCFLGPSASARWCDR
ncbi:hypothetical protein GCM10009830_02560 [Glycomyces endophyticus]|uniref:DUF2975 domain-containing protein n=1 Tax=Glycomyces endophyticus TaxID=480996 RepID=A0ABN2FWE2_9ACTN